MIQKSSEKRFQFNLRATTRSVLLFLLSFLSSVVRPSSHCLLTSAFQTSRLPASRSALCVPSVFVLPLCCISSQRGKKWDQTCRDQSRAFLYVRVCVQNKEHFIFQVKSGGKKKKKTRTGPSVLSDKSVEAEWSCNIFPKNSSCHRMELKKRRRSMCEGIQVIFPLIYHY